MRNYEGCCTTNVDGGKVAMQLGGQGPLQEQKQTATNMVRSGGGGYSFSLCSSGTKGVQDSAGYETISATA